MLPNPYKKFCTHFQSFEVGSKIDEIHIIEISKFLSKPLHLYSINNGNTYCRVKYV